MIDNEVRLCTDDDEVRLDVDNEVRPHVNDDDEVRSCVDYDKA